MVVTRKQRKEANPSIKLAHPDKSGPTEKTLLDIAQERNLFKQADKRQAKLARGDNEAEDDDSDSDDESDEDDEGEVLSTTGDRVMESILWGTSLTMLHFSLDVLVHRQYAMEFSWQHVILRSLKIWPIFLFFFFALHPHVSAPNWVPFLPSRFQHPLRQIVFFVLSVGSSCNLIQVTNDRGYLAVVKRSPPLGCLWVWSIVELDLAFAVTALACTYGFFWQGGYQLAPPQ